VLDTTSARAVFYSAATTIASFGSLAFSAHRGIASMGTLLSLGMLISLACNLIVLPALLEFVLPRRSAAETKAYS
jgi:predicted RND superfamily exporter protein